MYTYGKAELPHLPYYMYMDAAASLGLAYVRRIKVTPVLRGFALGQHPRQYSGASPWASIRPALWSWPSWGAKNGSRPSSPEPFHRCTFYTCPVYKVPACQMVWIPPSDTTSAEYHDGHPFHILATLVARILI